MTEIDGLIFEKMVRNGLANIKSQETEINCMNVFPVSDGDTGYNMRITLENGINSAKSTTNLGEYLNQLTEGMLLGARGNSGTILSQLFRGLYLEMAEVKRADSRLLQRAFVSAYKTGYASVVNPVEGTILTVCRQGAERIKGHIDGSSIEETFKAYIDEMNATLAETPDMLPILNENDVVDSGGVGYITIFEGMFKSLMGEDLEGEMSFHKDNEATLNVTHEIFNEDSAFEKCYCLEYVLQLLNSKHADEFNVDKYIEQLKKLGDSLVVTEAGNKRVKVHIHTFTPGEVLNISQSYGEFITFKMDNMQVQYNKFIRKNVENKKKIIKKDVVVVAAATGEGFVEIYEELGADVVLDSDANVLKQLKHQLEFIESSQIIFIPNVEEQQDLEEFIEGYSDKTIKMVNTKNMAEGYFALNMNMPDETFEERVSQIKYGAEDIDCLVFKSNNDLVTKVYNALEDLEDLEERDCLTLFFGKNVDVDAQITIKSELQEMFPYLEMQFFNGKQEDSQIIVGIM